MFLWGVVGVLVVGVVFGLVWVIVDLVVFGWEVFFFVFGGKVL